MEPLTPFEEYMLVDSHPAYPMSCFMFFRLKGVLDQDVFRHALQAALKRHPLLRSLVLCSFGKQTPSGQLNWVSSDEEPEVAVFFTKKSVHPPAKGIDLFQSPGLIISVLLDESAGQCLLRFEFHHSVSDGIGMLRFFEDAFVEYAALRGFPLPNAAPEVSLELLKTRCTLRGTGESHSGRRGFRRFLSPILKKPLKYFREFHRAKHFLWHRVDPLVPQKPDLARTTPPADFPALLSHHWSHAETQKMIERTKQQGLTLNDWVLRATYLAIRDWQKNENIPPGKGYLRLAVPTNLRTEADKMMPAANIVSMVFIDRKIKEIGEGKKFAFGLHREMHHVKRYNLGWAMIHGLALFRRFLGGIQRMVNQNRCWATATVTNLGICWKESPFPKRDGRLQLDSNLELTELDIVPPVRPQTALGICLHSYADQLRISMQYDTTLLKNEQARKLLRSLCDYLNS